MSDSVIQEDFLHLSGKSTKSAYRYSDARIRKMADFFPYLLVPESLVMVRTALDMIARPFAAWMGAISFFV